MSLILPQISILGLSIMEISYICARYNISHIGHPTVVCNPNDSSSKLLHWNNILHVPLIIKNLLYVFQFCKDNKVYLSFILASVLWRIQRPKPHLSERLLAKDSNQFNLSTCNIVASAEDKQSLMLSCLRFIIACLLVLIIQIKLIVLHPVLVSFICGIKG